MLVFLENKNCGLLKCDFSYIYCTVVLDREVKYSGFFVCFFFYSCTSV